MSNLQPIAGGHNERPRGQDLSGPEFLHYQAEWMKHAQKLFALGRDKTDKHRVDLKKTLDNPSSIAKSYHGEQYLEQLKNQPRYRNEVISSQNLYIDADDYIVELQIWNEEHPYGITEETERDVFYITFYYKNSIPEELEGEKIDYAVITSAEEAISIVMMDEERQTNPKRASEISKVLKDLYDDPQIHGHFLDPEIAKLEIAKLNQLN